MKLMLNVKENHSEDYLYQKISQEGLTSNSLLKIKIIV